jgi:hypothetical protein
MPNLNYPFDQDLAFNSFIITDSNILKSVLGRTYNQSELVPVSYPKIIAKSLVDVSIRWFPLQEFTYTSDALALVDLQNETVSNVQGNILLTALTDLFSYWKDQLFLNTNISWTTALSAPMVVATPREPQFIQNTVGGTFHLILKFDLVIYVLPTSIYA